MNNDNKGFMELTTPVKSKSDIVWNDLLGDLLSAMDTYFHLPTAGYENIHQYAEVSKIQNLDMLYFWEWMDDKGFDLLKGLDKRFPESDEIIEHLNYRRVVLGMDVSSGSLDIFLLSVTELLLAVSEFIAGYFETAATTATAIIVTNRKISLPYNQIENNDNNWKIIGSSDTIGAGLLLYL